MTNQTLPHPGRQSGTAPSRWAELTPRQRAGLVVTVVLLPCLGGAGVFGAVAGLSTVSSGEPAPSARRFAEAPPADEAAVPEARASRTPAPVQRTRTVTVTRRIPYATRVVRDKSLPKGKRVVRARGVPGVRALTFQVTVGRPGKRKLIRSAVIRRPVTRVIVVGAGTPCDLTKVRITGFVMPKVFR
ncbi:G5 domain-containing protein [Krasilnikovia sp. MM14-A1259]|uniref:G5 domain-containing protein n=1 Tax=Krasilnikovia sp. MM14-A1259 TaxID=3373539 RepID=UPI0037F2DBB6